MCNKCTRIKLKSACIMSTPQTRLTDSTTDDNASVHWSVFYSYGVKRKWLRKSWLCVCVCARACVHVCARMCVSMCACVCVCVHACVHACMRGRTCLCMCVCARAHVCMRACLHACVCVCVQKCMCNCAWICIICQDWSVWDWISSNMEL